MSRIPGDPTFRPGHQVSAQELQRISDVAGRVERGVTVGGAVAGYSSGDGTAINVEPDAVWWVRILGQSGSNPVYSWQTVRRNNDDDGWEMDENGPAADYTSYPLREVNGHTGVPLMSVHRAWWCEDGRSILFDCATGGGTNLTVNNTNNTTTNTGGTTTNNNTTISNTGTTTTTNAPGTSVSIGGAVLYPPDGSPTTISSNTNNLALTAGSIYFLDVTNDVDLSSIVAGVDGRRIIIVNYGTATLKILHESTAGTAANRIHCPYAQDVVFPTRFAAELQYDGAITRWRLLWASDILNPGVGQTATISTDQHNFVFDRGKPSLAFDLGDDIDITGFAGGVKGYVLRVAVVHTDPGLYTLNVKHLSGSSLAANRIVTPYGVDFRVLSGGGMTVYYDGSLWRVLATRDIFVEQEIVYGGVGGIPISSPDFIRESEGVIRQSIQHNSNNPIHRLYRERASAASVTAGDVAGSWIGTALVDDVETDLGMVQVVYYGDGEGTIELWANNGTELVRGFRVMPTGRGMFDEADMPEELLGTDAAGQVVNISIGTGLDLTDGLLTATSGSGTVTSVGLALPSDVFDITTGVVTTAGTLTASFLNQTANRVFAGPTTGGPGIPSFRALVAADFPAGIGTGTVTSVALALPSIFTVSGSPVTTSGTLTGSLATQTANTVFAGPVSGGAAAPTFRALVTADFPTGVITLAKLEDIATDRLLGRDTAGTGAVEQLTVTGGLEFTGSGGIQRSALTGDVTATAGSNATTVANGVISNAKLADMTTKTIKARKAGSTGAPEDCTLSEVLDFITSAAQGDLLYRGSSAWSRLAAGTALQLLRTGGAGADPAWANPDMRSLVSVICRAHRASGSLTVNNATWTTVTLNAESYDTNAMHSTVSNTEQLVVPSGMGGAWFLWVECNPQYVSGSIASQINVMINGGALTEASIPAGVTSTLIYVQTASAGDYFSAGIRQSSGSSQTFPSGGGYLSLGALYLGVV